MTGRARQGGQALAVPATPANAVDGPSGFDPGETWTSYAEARPSEAGVYEWRVPSRTGVIVQFFAHMRKRGAGFESVISPVFDRWDGWRVHVPGGTEWRAVAEPPALKTHEETITALLGVKLAVCPFCNRVPSWRGIYRSGGGFIVGGHPHEYTHWWLECCGWAKTPHMTDPLALASKRNAALAPTETGTAETQNSGSVRSMRAGKAPKPTGKESDQ